MRESIKRYNNINNSTMFYSYGWMKSKGIGHTYIYCGMRELID
jgi:hypothetical protein